MPITTVGNLLINSVLPKDLRDYNRVLSSSELKKLAQKVAERYPEKYQQIIFDLSRLGKDFAYETGSYSFGVSDLQESEVYKKKVEELKKKFYAIALDPKKSKNDKQEEIRKLVLPAIEQLTKEVMDEQLAKQNKLALMVSSGMRGKPVNVLSIIGGDLLYEDHRDRPSMILVDRGYAKGLSPAQYLASASGARKAVLGTKLAIRDAGAFAKQLVAASHRLVVTALDRETSPQFPLGYPVETSDNDNLGALLAQPIGGYPANTIITPQVLQDLNSKGIKKILIRSPILPGPPDGGLYARDAGVRERNTLSPIGDFVGITAAQAIAEPISQGTLRTKHTGGSGGQTRSLAGFKVLEQLVHVPQNYPEGAAHANTDGIVEKIEPAPQGGHYIYINNLEHYVPVTQNILVKPGQKVEAGDLLSDGIPNPAIITAHKGIGEGRRYFIDTFKKAMTDSGFTVHRRNIEVIAKALINHVEITDLYQEFLPGDIVAYDVIESKWQARPGTQIVPVEKAVGKYLELPVLHLSIGTKIRPSIVQMLKEFNITKIAVHDEEPPFKPVMVSGRMIMSYDRDWMTKFLGGYLQRGLLEAVHRFSQSNEYDTSYVPIMARGIELGLKGKTKGIPIPEGPPPRKPSRQEISVLDQLRNELGFPVR